MWSAPTTILYHRPVRVRRTFGFLDLTGFTALTETRGDRHAVVVLGVFRSALREICSRRGVRIAKWLGDGAMLVGVETTPLVCATLEMQYAMDAAPESITVKCGIAPGSVILLEGDDYIGHAVNMASRLCESATGREILAVPDVVPELPPWAVTEEREKISLQGFEQPVEVLHVGLPWAGHDCVPDPICNIPLTKSTAVERRHDANGLALLFCSESCSEAWDQQRSIVEHDAGSVREVWMR
jgi:adenylate cyclase